MKGAGKTEWDNLFPPTNIRIKVDANSGTSVQYVLHELLHILLHTMFLGYVDDTLEEVAVVAYDTYVYEYVKKSPKRFALWSSLIEEKIATEKTDTPLEEMVAR